MILATGCQASPPVSPRVAPSPLPEPTAKALLKAEPGSPWPASVGAPRPAQGASELETKLMQLCSISDQGMHETARALAERLQEGRRGFDDLSFELRSRGSPQVWPLAWTLSGESLNPADAVSRAKRWLEKQGKASVVCGAGAFQRRAAVLIVADALGALEPLPVRVRSKTWLRIKAKTLVPAEEAKVVVLGPQGLPRRLPTTFDGGHIGAAFSPDKSGRWLIQVLATLASGPRPILEAEIYADLPPPTQPQAHQAPGEEAGNAAKEDDEGLARMINDARRQSGLRPLRRDRALDALAAAHAKAMRRAQRLAHNIGEGSIRQRAEKAGLSPRSLGENVARAASLPRAHRVIWQSPSHRSNVLEARFKRLGVGVAREGDGVWVCQIFADFG